MADLALQGGIFRPPVGATPPDVRAQRLRAAIGVSGRIQDSGPFHSSMTGQRDVAFVPPVIAEFGHELMAVGYLRYLAPNYKRIVVSTRKSRHALYTDFVKEFMPHPFKCECNIMSPKPGHAPPPDQVAAFHMPDAQRVELCQHTSRVPGKWVMYGKADKNYLGVTVIHARSRNHVRARNWPVKRWNVLLATLRDEGLIERVVCIGSPDAAVLVPGCEDARGLPLAKQMNILRSAEVAIGPSSGPMHLASMCGCPHVVWCGGPAQESGETSRRYAAAWNPFGTPASAARYANWRPAPVRVAEWTRSFLKRIRAGEKPTEVLK